MRCLRPLLLLLSDLAAGPQIAASAMVCLWAARLGSFLVARVVKTGGDSRFDEAKHQPGTFFVYWTMQVGGGSGQRAQAAAAQLTPPAAPRRRSGSSPRSCRCLCSTPAREGPRAWWPPTWQALRSSRPASCWRWWPTGRSRRGAATRPTRASS
jgi:hypothetical protein